MFPRAAPAGYLNANGDMVFTKLGSRILMAPSPGGRVEQRTLFQAPPGNNTVFGAIPGAGANVAAIQVYSRADLVNPSGFRYGDLRATPGFIVITSAALGPDSTGTGAPSAWPLKFNINGVPHVIGTDGSWSFNNGQTLLDLNGQLGLGVTPAARLHIGTGGVLQFDRPDGTNSFQNYYKANDLLLTWNFNAGATLMSLSSAGLLVSATFASASWTAHGVLLGQGTSAATVASPGSAGQVLVSNGASADPTFQTLPATSGVYSRIAQIVTSGSQATIDFSGIPATYTTLELIITGRDTKNSVADVQFRMKINNDGTAANYGVSQFHDGTNTTSAAGTVASSTDGSTGGSIPGSGTSGTNAVGMARIMIANYAQTTFQKAVQSLSFVSSTSTPITTIYNIGFVWKSTAAINQITLKAGGTAFVDGTIATLYGLP